MRILIVEDEPPIAEGLKFNFEEEGYDVSLAGDGETALQIARDDSQPVDLVILDLMLPGMSGFEICKAIRGMDEAVPILVLSARFHSQDKAHAFDCGADQYVTKPFELHEVLSRVRNLLKRRPQERPAVAADEAGETGDVFQFDNVIVDFARFQVVVDGTPQGLTTMEMQLLRYFIENAGVVLSRARILEDVWEQSPETATRSIDNFVMRLRRLLEPNPSQPRHFLSVRGTGYRFVANADDAKGGNGTT